MNKKEVCIALGIVLCLAGPVMAQQTPFVINGYVFDVDNSPYSGPTVQVTNLNTSMCREAESTATSNHYQLVLATGAELNASEVVRLNVTGPEGAMSRDCTVSAEDVRSGGLFNVNVTLEDVNAQTWYLTSEPKPAGAPTANDSRTHVKDNLMQKGARSGTGKSFYLDYTEAAWFYADTGAECSLGFGENPWEAHIRTEGIEDDEVGHNLSVDVCALDPDTGAVTVLAHHTEQLTAVGSIHLWNITCGDNESTMQEFSTGDWLAVRLAWDCETDELRIYYGAEAGCDSYIESPSSDPGYPIPELPTILLSGLGLLVIAGYVTWRRRKK
jgi:hypothetical protein